MDAIADHRKVDEFRSKYMAAIGKDDGAMRPEPTLCNKQQLALVPKARERRDIKVVIRTKHASVLAQAPIEPEERIGRAGLNSVNE